MTESKYFRCHRTGATFRDADGVARTHRPGNRIGRFEIVSKLDPAKPGQFDEEGLAPLLAMGALEEVDGPDADEEAAAEPAELEEGDE